MERTRDIPDLLERFMEESGETKRWVTVNELRTYFHLDEFAAPSLSGFLQRIYQDSFFSCPYRVERIEKIAIRKPKHRIIKRYLVTKRPGAHRKNPPDINTPLSGSRAHDIFTDSDAIDRFGWVLKEKHEGNEG
jgi:hypothetical protein